jgi:UDP-GlcNAc:undecaprenyl-phosphate GlcNAc-1-phosphate transferase
MFYAFAIAFLSGLIFNLVAERLGRKIRFFKSRSQDGRYGVSKLGGVSIVLSFFLAVSLILIRCGSLDQKLAVILISVGASFLLGMTDDLLVLPPFKKLAVQFIISLLLVGSGVKTHIIYLSSFLNSILTILWFLAIMNAFNFLDILDGLAAGISVICAATFLLICVIKGNGVAGAVLAAILGSNLAFLGFNKPEARLYMGDAGSLFNGMVFAAMALTIGYAPRGHEIALFVPVMILGLPLYDLIFVVIMRLKQNKPLIKKSRDHFVLRMVDQGMPASRVVLLMYFFNILFGLIALALLSSGILQGFLILIFSVVAWLLFAYKISSKEKVRAA